MNEREDMQALNAIVQAVHKAKLAGMKGSSVYKSGRTYKKREKKSR